MSDWNDRDKFRAETWRTAIFGVAGFLALIAVVAPFERTAAYNTALDREQLSARLAAIRRFEGASAVYGEAVRDVLAPTDGGRTDADALARYQGRPWEAYVASLAVLRGEFPGSLETELSDASCLNDRLRVIIGREYDFDVRSPEGTCIAASWRELYEDFQKANAIVGARGRDRLKRCFPWLSFIIGAGAFLVLLVAPRRIIRKVAASQAATTAMPDAP